VVDSANAIATVGGIHGSLTTIIQAPPAVETKKAFVVKMLFAVVITFRVHARAVFYAVRVVVGSITPTTTIRKFHKTISTRDPDHVVGGENVIFLETRT